jgi:hypothetical protein
MSRVSPSAVFLPMPSDVSFAEAMSRLRMWFDNKKIQPTTFRLKHGEATGFEIGFQNESEASTFDAGFDWCLPPA